MTAVILTSITAVLAGVTAGMQAWSNKRRNSGPAPGFVDGCACCEADCDGTFDEDHNLCLACGH